MMVLSALSTYALRPTKTIFFDKYPVMNSIANCNHVVERDSIKRDENSGSTNTMDSRVVPVEESGFQEKFDDI